MNSKILLIMIGFLYLFYLSGCSSQKDNVEQVPVDIKNSLQNWGENLPTVYILEEIRPYCNGKLQQDCLSSDILINSYYDEGYVLAFEGQKRGIGSVFSFGSSFDAQQQFDLKLQKVEGDRGYEEFSVSKNCFGWKGDFGYGFPQIICHESNVIYHVISSGLSTSDLREFTKELGNEIK